MKTMKTYVFRNIGNGIESGEKRGREYAGEPYFFPGTKDLKERKEKN